MNADSDDVRRWRLVLGRYAEGTLPSSSFDSHDSAIERSLSYLYDREYAARHHRMAGPRAGSLDPSAPTALHWLGEARRLFPQSTFERMQVHAIERYQLTDLLADEATAASLTPSPELGAALLSIRGRLDRSLENGVRTVIAATVDEIVRRLRPAMKNSLHGRRSRRRSPQRNSQNFDWRATITANLAHYDRASQQLAIEHLRFTSRTRRSLPWDVIICVDQSGSMAQSVMYSAICASILSALPGINVRLVLFDTSIADVSHLAADPVAVLMTAQLGGGTNIAGALSYCESLVVTPARTVVALVSDFEEGGSVTQLLASVSRLTGAGATLIGLAALDEEANPSYDRAVAERLASRGMQIAALTPEHFAEWLGEVMT